MDVKNLPKYDQYVKLKNKTYWEDCKLTCESLFTTAPQKAWEHLKEGLSDLLNGIGSLIWCVVGILLTLSFPISVWIISFAVYKDRLKSLKNYEERYKEVLERDNKLCFKENRNGQ